MESGRKIEFAQESMMYSLGLLEFLEINGELQLELLPPRLLELDKIYGFHGAFCQRFSQIRSQVFCTGYRQDGGFVWFSLTFEVF